MWLHPINFNRRKSERSSVYELNWLCRGASVRNRTPPSEPYAHPDHRWTVRFAVLRSLRRAPRFDQLTQTCVTVIEDPGLLLLGLKPKPALQFRVEET
jgi:hypothetical protein